MKLKLILAISLTLAVMVSHGQSFMNFVITREDSLFKGMMKISLDGSNGRKFEIFDFRQNRSKSFHIEDH